MNDMASVPESHQQFTQSEIETNATRHLDLDLVEDEESGFMNISVEDSHTNVATAGGSSPLNGFQLDNSDEEINSDDSLGSDSPKKKRNSKKNKGPQKPVIPDLGSETLFPSLGSPKAPNASGLPSRWGSKPVSNLGAASPSAAAAPPSNMTVERLTMKVAQTPQASKQLRETVAKVQKRLGVTVDVSSSRLSETATFLIKGRTELVAKAEREIKAGLAPKGTLRVQVPASVIGFVLGAKGRNLNLIQQRTMTTIEVPRRDEVAGANQVGGDSDDLMLSVSITGDLVGVQQAKAEIEAIVKEKEVKKEIKITEIPQLFYPLLAGPDDSRISEYTGQDSTVQVNIPFLVGRSTRELESMDTSISIIGGKESANLVMEKILTEYRRLEKSTQDLTLSIPKPKHRFLIGPWGLHFKEILAASGCVVVIPEPDDPSDKVTVYGPDGKQVAALTEVMSKANSAHATSLNLSSIHKKSPAEYRENLLVYLRTSPILVDLEAECSVQIHLPTSSKHNGLDIVGRLSDQVNQAKLKLEKIISELTPAQLGSLTIPYELHGFVMGPNREKLNKLEAKFDVKLFMEPKSNRVVLYGTTKDNITNAKAHLEKAIHGLTEIAVEKVKIPTKVQPHMCKEATLHGIIGKPGASTAHIEFGINNKGESSEEVLVRGPTKEVKRVCAKLQALAIELADYEKAMSYVTSFNIPAKHSAHVVGKGGANFSRIKDKFDVKVDIEQKSSGKEEVQVKIKGLKKNADSAKEDIISLVERLKDQTEEKLRVPSQFHRAIIGAKGKYVKRLEDKYGVRIRFPKSANNQDEDDEDHDEDIPISKDEIILRGGRKGVSEAKAEIMEVVEYEKENSIKLAIRVHRKFLPYIMGKNGAIINEIKDETQTRIDVADDGEECDITIIGTKQGTKDAQKRIQSVITKQETQVTETMSIDSKYHSNLIGPGGAKLRALVAQCQKLDPQDPQVQARMVRFPKPGSSSDQVSITGDKELVAKIKLALEGLVQKLESMVTITVDIAVDHHAALIGQGGSNLRHIMTKHNVNVRIPRKEERSSNITISGTSEACEAAKQELLAKVPSQEELQLTQRDQILLLGLNRISVPKMKGEFQCQLVLPNINEVKLPEFSSDANQSEMARIDADNASSQPTKTMIDLTPFASHEVTWKLRGAAPSPTKAKKFIELQLKELAGVNRIFRCYVPTQSHRLIVGRNGATVDQLRGEYKVDIILPTLNNGPTPRRGQADPYKLSDGQGIVIVGLDSNCHDAMDRIGEIVKSAKH